MAKVATPAGSIPVWLAMVGRITRRLATTRD